VALKHPFKAHTTPLNKHKPIYKKSTNYIFLEVFKKETTTTWKYKHGNLIKNKVKEVNAQVKKFITKKATKALCFMCKILRNIYTNKHIYFWNKITDTNHNNKSCESCNLFKIKSSVSSEYILQLNSFINKQRLNLIHT